jgi:hypothetical protein
MEIENGYWKMVYNGQLSFQYTFDATSDSGNYSYESAI